MDLASDARLVASAEATIAPATSFLASLEAAADACAVDVVGVRGVRLS